MLWRGGVRRGAVGRVAALLPFSPLFFEGFTSDFVSLLPSVLPNRPFKSSEFPSFPGYLRIGLGKFPRPYLSPPNRYRLACREVFPPRRLPRRKPPLTPPLTPLLSELRRWISINLPLLPRLAPSLLEIDPVLYILCRSGI